MQYSKKLLQYFMNPQNQGDIKNPDGVGQVGNPKCGDIMKMYILVDKNNIIEDIKFETLGCAAAIAASSTATVLVKGKTISEAEKLTKDDIVRELEGMPPEKVHCSLLGVEAIHKAIENYKNTKK